MKTKTILYQIVVLFIIVGCNEDEEPRTLILTSSGNEISMDGIWQSDCIDFTAFSLKEDFDFDGNNLVITINRFETSTCENTDASEKVTISFEVVGTMNATLNGNQVLANLVTGTEKSNQDSQSSKFKQTFYVNDHDGVNRLYHGVFEDDGGTTSDDGFPLDLHPFAIVQL